MDHIGPVSYASGQGMRVRSHPHIGLQTFTWMIAGEIAHHDSLGFTNTIRPNEINLMTAGRGIAHTEISQDEGFVHAVQLWIALPDSHKNMPPDFQHYARLPMWEENGVKQTLLVGTWCERQSEVQVYTPLLAVDVLAQQEVTHRWALQVDFEYGILPLEGSICVNGQHLEVGMMAYVAPGSVSVEIAAEKDARYFIIGGEPLHEELIVWWNLIARTPEEIAQARAQWEAQSARFGDLPQLGEWLHAPELSGSLKASGPKQNT